MFSYSSSFSNDDNERTKVTFFFSVIYRTYNKISGLLSRNKNKDESKRFILVLVDLAALTAQATSFVLWPLLDTSRPSLWVIPPSLILVSCGWWENYVSMQSSIGKFFLYYSIQRVQREYRTLISSFFFGGVFRRTYRLRQNVGPSKERTETD